MKRVLLIEDDAWLGESYERILSLQFTVTRVKDLAGALAVVNQQLPDVIVADFMLEGRNSLELLHELSSYEDTAGIPVVLCSALGKEIAAYQDKLVHYGVVAVCDKADLTPESFRRVVNEAAAVAKGV